MKLGTYIVSRLDLGLILIYLDNVGIILGPYLYKKVFFIFISKSVDPYENELYKMHK